MSLPSLLMRLLLCVSLTLNGPGLVASAAAMHDAGTMAPTRHAALHQGMAGHSHHHMPQHATPAHALSGHASAQPDCCPHEGNGCQHACHAQPSPATLVAGFVAMPPPAQSMAARATGPEHDSPPPPRLIRPPIARA